MTLKSPHSDFTLQQVLQPQVRWVYPANLMTQLWLRIAFGNKQVKVEDTSFREIGQIASAMTSGSSRFVGFDSGDGIAEAWIRSDLVESLAKEATSESAKEANKGDFSVARPLHLLATRLRNTTRSGDSNASAIPYQWITEQGEHLIDDLRGWLNVGEDEADDLPSHALALLAQDRDEDLTIDRDRTGNAKSLCRKQGQLYVEDLRALMAYRGHLPRITVVDHIRRLTMLHLALHLLQTFAIVKEIDWNPDDDHQCDANGNAGCSLVPKLVVDCGEDARTDVARHAEYSWGEVETLLASYVRSNWRLKKLTECANSRSFEGEDVDTDDLRSLSALRNGEHQREVDRWANVQIDSLMKDKDQDRDDLGKRNFEEILQTLTGLDRSPFESYMSMLFSEGEKRWVGFNIQVLDSLFGRRDRDGLMLMPLGGRRKRRLALSSPLLETLVYVAMVEFHGELPSTRSLRVDQLIDRLEHRYGLLVTRPADSKSDDPNATKAMARNKEAFLDRLRQTGLYVDQSDAFLSQMIRPRVQLS